MCHKKSIVMTLDDVMLLDTPELMALIDANVERDPNAVALDKHVPHAALVATQVKYLQRARHKLPSYYEVRAILPPLSFEQSSSETAAGRHEWNGELCVDLTCGLGVDTLYLSRRFSEVMTVESDPVLAAVARINFARLGAENITVVNLPSERFVAEFVASGRRADMVYADPDRRSAQGRKMVRLEDCSPDMIALMPQLEMMTGCVAVKLSPMFDVVEAFRIFDGGCEVEVYSQRGECKEVTVVTGRDVKKRVLCAHAEGRGMFAVPYPPADVVMTAGFEPCYAYMLIPDVVLRKSRLVAVYAALKLHRSYATAVDGYVFLNEIPSEGAIGRIFEIEYMERFDAVALKKKLRSAGVRSADIYVHAFPISAQDISRRLGIKEGGNSKLAFARINGLLWAIGLKEVNLY